MNTQNRDQVKQKLILETRFLEIVGRFQELKPLLVVGDIGLDKYTQGEVRRISPEAPVPILEVQKEWFKLGLAANVADNLKSLGVNSTLMGIVGEDSRASKLENLLEDQGLKTWGLLREKNRQTTYKERVTTTTQQICRIDYESQHPLSEESLRLFRSRCDSFLSNHSGFIIEDYGKGMISQSLMQDVLSLTRNHKQLIAVDPSRSTPPLWYKGVDLLKPNLAETKMMVASLGFTHPKDLKEMAHILIDKLSLKKLIMTLGPEGMAILDTSSASKGEDLLYIPTVANEVYDVSGAGDTAIATIMASLESGASLVEAAWIGNCAAGVVVQKRGTALCTIDELKGFYQRLLVSFKQ